MATDKNVSSIPSSFTLVLLLEDGSGWDGVSFLRP